MANIYVRSSDGNNGDSGATWALAKATITGADATPEVAGDVICVSSTHSETSASSPTFFSAGTSAAQTKIISVDDSAEPPTTLAAGAVIGFSGSNTITFAGSLYTYGLTIEASTSASYGLIYFGNTNASQFQIHEAMTMRIVGTHGASQINFGRDGLQDGFKFILINCSVRFAASNQGMQATSSRVEWKNGVNGGSAVGLEAGGTSPTYLWENIGDFDNSTTGRSSNVLMEGLDLSAGAVGMHICNRLTGGSVLTVRNCKLPASWTGSLVNTAPEHGAIATMINCDNGDTNYRFRQQTRPGLLTDETTVVMTGGASDGDTPISWKVVTTTVCGPGSWWESPEMYVEQTATGSAKTVTVEILHDSVTDLTDAEVWVEVDVLGTSGQPLSVSVHDRATVLATPVDQPNSAVTWTTTGLTNPNKQYLSVSVTPQEKGFLIARVYVAKVSKMLYINPEPIIT